MPAAKRAAPTRGPDQLVHRDARGHQPGVADAEVAPWPRPSAAGCRWSCRRRPRRCRAGTCVTRTTVTSTRPVTSAAVRTTSTRGPHQVDRDHEAPAVDPVGEDAGVEAEQQPRQALEQAGQRDEERVGGLRGDQQRTRRRARCRRRGCRSTTSRPASGTASPCGPGGRLPRRGSRGGNPRRTPGPGTTTFLEACQGRRRTRASHGRSVGARRRAGCPAPARRPAPRAAASASGYGVRLTLQTTSSDVVRRARG